MGVEIPAQRRPTALWFGPGWEPRLLDAMKPLESLAPVFEKLGVPIKMSQVRLSRKWHTWGLGCILLVFVLGFISLMVWDVSRDFFSNAVIVDDQSEGFSSEGSFSVTQGYGYQDSALYSRSGPSKAMWRFSGMEPGRYSIATSRAICRNILHFSARVFATISEVRLDVKLGLSWTYGTSLRPEVVPVPPGAMLGSWRSRLEQCGGTTIGSAISSDRRATSNMRLGTVCLALRLAAG